MSNMFNVRIKCTRDTSANWTTNNPVLLNGELALVDTNAGELRIKIGDGVKTYSQLPFSDEILRSLIDNKVEKISGKGLSTNDYTNEEKNKLAELEALVGSTSVSSQISGALSAIDYPVDSVNGETGAVTVTAESIGALSSTDIISMSQGGTGATDAGQARTNLGITPANIGAATSGHTHALTASTITGTLNIDKGGTGATSASDARNNLDVYSKAEVDAKSGGLSTSTILNLIYPVGAIYLSTVSTNPGTLFGGTWVQLKDVFLATVGSQFSAGETGGASAHYHIAPVCTRNSNTIGAIAPLWGTTTRSTSSSETKAVWSTTSNSSSFSDLTMPYTSSGTNLPPYLAVYGWKRTA